MLIAALVVGTLTGYFAAGVALALGLPLWGVALTLLGCGSLTTVLAAGALAHCGQAPQTEAQRVAARTA